MYLLLHRESQEAQLDPAIINNGITTRRIRHIKPATNTDKFNSIFSVFNFSIRKFNELLQATDAPPPPQKSINRIRRHVAPICTSRIIWLI